MKNSIPSLKNTGFGIILSMLFILRFGFPVNVAILDFTPKGVSEQEASQIADFFRGDLVRHGELTILDRNNMDKILDEQAFQHSGCTDSACAVELGKLLNMEYMFLGTVSKLGQRYILSIDMVDVESATIKLSERKDVGTIEEMLSVTSELADRFVAQIGGNERTAKPRSPKNSSAASGLRPLLFSSGGLLLGGAGYSFLAAEKAFDNYNAAVLPDDAVHYREQTETLDTLKWVFLGAGAVLGISGFLVQGSPQSASAGHSSLLLSWYADSRDFGLTAVIRY